MKILSNEPTCFTMKAVKSVINFVARMGGATVHLYDFQGPLAWIYLMIFDFLHGNSTQQSRISVILIR